MSDDEAQPESPPDASGERPPKRIRGTVIRMSREELEQRGFVIP